MFGKVIEELNAENTEGDDMKTLEELYYYISVCANNQTPDKGSRLPSDSLAAYGCSMMCWRRWRLG
jgi:hypothetical protein